MPFAHASPAAVFTRSSGDVISDLLNLKVCCFGSISLGHALLVLSKILFIIQHHITKVIYHNMRSFYFCYNTPSTLNSCLRAWPCGKSPHIDAHNSC